MGKDHKQHRQKPPAEGKYTRPEDRPQPQPLDRPPQRFDNPACCGMGALHVSWEEQDRTPGAFGFIKGPHRTGWAIGIGESFAENVKFCPWCGKNLAAVPPAKARV